MAHTNPPQDPAALTVASDDTPDQQTTLANAQNGPTSSRALSFSSIRSGKSKHAEAGITQVHADQASLSMPPPASRPVRRIRAPSQTSREFNDPETGNDDAVFVPSAALESGSFSDSAVTEDSTPRLVPGAFSDKPEEHALPDPAMPPSRSSFSEDNKRMSISSIYSLASARGIPSSAASANGSDTGSAGAARSVSGFMASSAPKHGDTGVSNVTVTTQGSCGGNLAPREQHQYLADIVKRNGGPPAVPRPEPSGAASRSQPGRDRSRAKRRLSGGTAASSHSPSSDRTLHHKEKEEGLFCLSYPQLRPTNL